MLAFLVIAVAGATLIAVRSSDAVGAAARSQARMIVASQVTGCLRGIADRAANAAAWYAAYQAHETNAETSTGEVRRVDLRSATTYLDTAYSLNSRVDAAHSLTVDGRHPLGLGRLDCARAFRTIR